MRRAIFKSKGKLIFFWNGKIWNYREEDFSYNVQHRDTKLFLYTPLKPYPWRFKGLIRRRMNNPSV